MHHPQTTNDETRNTKHDPRCSLLIAARNEAANLPALLASLDALQLPPGGLEIWFGDDGSADATPKILAAWVADRPNTYVLTITNRLPGLAGKANVLAQLAQQTQAELLLFTDADCAVPATWATALASTFAQGGEPLGIVTGCTTVRGQSLFAGMQAVDWLAAQWVIWVLALLRVRVTAMGNNMALRRSAYRAAGGFEAVQSSIVEDYTLFVNVLKAGYGFGHIYAPGVLATTAAQPTWSAWLAQRKRWFVGAMQLPFATQLPFWFNIGWYPALLALGGVAGWPVALGLAGGKFTLQLCCFGSGLLRLRLWGLLPYLLLYDAYAVVTGLWLWLSYLRSQKVEWKGRAY